MNKVSVRWYREC